MNAGAALAVEYFDGLSAKARPALMQLDGADLVLLQADSPYAPITRVPRKGLSWPERHAPRRMLNLPNGGQVLGTDTAAWDAWAQRELPGSAGWVAHAQARWSWAIGSLAALVAVCAAAYVWGLPWVSRNLAHAVPHDLEAQLGKAAMAQIDAQMVKPTKLSAQEQAQWRAAFADMLKKAYPADKLPPHTLEFRRFEQGPNAFAVPGGTMVLTDELVEMSRHVGPKGQDMVLGVLAHEFGHVEHRHALRGFVSVSVLGAATALLFGDVGSVVAAVPLWLGQAKYSRDMEREADDASLRIVQAAGISPLGMVLFFRQLPTEMARRAKLKCEDEALEKLKRRREAAGDSSVMAPDEVQAAVKACVALEDKFSKMERSAESSTFGLAISSHPGSEERIAKFEQAARKP